MAKGDPTNVDRAGRAYKMLRHYQDRIRTDQEDDVKTIIEDALTDMLHLARFEKLDWAKMTKLAKRFFDDEVEKENTPRDWSPRGWPPGTWRRP